MGGKEKENVKTRNRQKLTKIPKLQFQICSMPSSEIQVRHSVRNKNSMLTASIPQTTQMLYKARFP